MIVPRSRPQSCDVSGHYDELDRVYREVWGEHVHHGYWRSGDERTSEAVDALADLVGEHMEPEAGQHFCDIGCGYGALKMDFKRAICAGSAADWQRSISASRLAAQRSGGTVLRRRLRDREHRTYV